MRVKWLESAINSFDSAMAYIAKEDAEAAIKISEYIQARIDSLRKQPSQGRQGRIFGTRELVIDKYPFIIPYRVKDGELQILRVFHTSQRPPQKW